MRAIVTDERTAKNLKTFDGPTAIDDAIEYVVTLPEYEKGRYGIDSCIPREDAHCDGCDCFALADQIIQGFDDEIEGYLYMRFGD